MKKLNKLGALASIFGLGLAAIGLLSANAESEYVNNNQNNSGNVFNQPTGNIKIDNSVTTNISNQASKTVSTHDGAGALLMLKPDFGAFVSLEKHSLHIGRLINGTELKVLGCEEFAASAQLALQIPWCKVEVVGGALSTQVGWLPSKNIVKL